VCKGRKRKEISKGEKANEKNGEKTWHQKKRETNTPKSHGADVEGAGAGAK